MVKTRAGRAVIHTEGSFGRAARQELKRCMKKMGLSQQDGVMHVTPRRTTRVHVQEEEELAKPAPTSSHRVAVPTPSPTRN